MKRKQIIEFALEFFEAGMESQKFGMPSFDQIIEADYYKRYIDAILAIPLDVPSDEDISTTAYDYCMFEGGEEGEPEADPETYRHFRDGMNCMRDEIIKRNK